MAKIELEINGKAYPCRYTNGAMLRFKHETGYDISQSSGVADNIVLLYCCIVSACKADGVDFPYDLETFADNTPVEVVAEWVENIQTKQRKENKSSGGKKK